MVGTGSEASYIYKRVLRRAVLAMPDRPDKQVTTLYSNYIILYFYTYFTELRIKQSLHNNNLYLNIFIHKTTKQ